MDTFENNSSNSERNRQQANPRRRFIFAGILVTLGSSIFGIGSIIASFLKPVKENSYGGMIDAGTLIDLKQKNSEPLLNAQGRFWLIQNDQGVMALHSSCTHLDCRFGWDSTKNLFVCPCHGSQFRLDGTVLNGPATRSLDQFPISLTGAEGEIIRQTGNEGGYLPIDDLNLAPPENKEPASATRRIRIIVDTGKKIPGHSA